VPIDGCKQPLIQKHHSSWVFLSQILQTGLAFSRSIILARTLGVELYGVLCLVLALAATLRQLLSLNLETVVIKFGATFRSLNETGKLSALIKGSLYCALFSLFLFMVAIVSATFFAYEVFFETPNLQILVLIYAFYEGLVLLQSPGTGVLKLNFNFRLIAIVGSGASCLEILLLIGAVYFYPMQLLPVIVALTAARLVGTGVYISASFGELRRLSLTNPRVKVAVLRDDWKDIRSFTMCNALSKSLKALTASGDVLLLGALSTPYQVGLYSVAKKIGLLVPRIAAPMVSTVYPQLSSLISERRLQQIKLMLVTLTKSLLLITIPVIAAVVLLNKWLLTTIYGHEYSEATAILLILLLVGAIRTVFFWSTSLILSLQATSI